MAGPSFDRAFRALFAEQSARLHRYVSAVCGDAALAEDVVEECFVRLYRRGEMPDNPAAWLVTVAHNLLRDERRRATRRRRLLLERRDVLPLGDPPPEPDAATLAAERIAAVRQALARLPERDRRLLLLRYEGYSYQEIAATLGVAPGGIGTMLIRATAAFRKAFNDLSGARD